MASGRTAKSISAIGFNEIMKVHFIVNERAGGYKGKKVWQAIQPQINFPYAFFKTTAPFSAANYVMSLETLEEPQLIVAIGGDGTIHEVVNGTIGRDDLIVSCMRGGSGNDFARGIHCFESFKEIASFVREQQQGTIAIDVGTIESLNLQRNFINNCGLGFDAYVCELVNNSKMKKFLNKMNLGKLSYVYIMLRALFTYKPFTISVKVDGASEGQVYENVWFLTISNQPYFGGGMKISPNSAITDEQLEMTLVHSLPTWKFLLLFLTVYNGKHLKYREVFHRPIGKLQCELKDPVYYHTDGEAQLLDDVTYEVFVNESKLMIPK